MTLRHVVVTAKVISKIKSKIKSGEGGSPFFPCLIEILSVLQAPNVLLWRNGTRIMRRDKSFKASLWRNAPSPALSHGL